MSFLSRDWDRRRLFFFQDWLSCTQAPIVKAGDPVLIEPASAVPVADITTPRIQKIITDMISLMCALLAIGLSAPQIGIPLQGGAMEDIPMVENTVGISEGMTSCAEGFVSTTIGEGSEYFLIKAMQHGEAQGVIQVNRNKIGYSIGNSRSRSKSLVEVVKGKRYVEPGTGRVDSVAQGHKMVDMNDLILKKMGQRRN
ncbi:hypothetical protein L7F22_015633 [Adiantum nelumboides]|nr:hypothetical protein [Adiantum nelumboides]